jgi:hypothetical protein
MPKFSQELFDTICQRIAKGESLRKICEDADMPTRNNFEAWAESTDDLRGQYARAREARAEHIFDEMLGIADDEAKDPQRDRLRIDTRKWMLSKMAPKKYGDKLELGGTGEGGAIIFKTVYEGKE